MERGICPIASVCTILLSRSRDPGHASVSETFLRGHVATIPGTCLSNLKFVHLAVLELLAFNAQKIYGGHVTLDTPTYRKLLSGVVSGLSFPGNTPAKFEVHLTPKHLRVVSRVTVTAPTFYLSHCSSIAWDRL